MPPCDSDADDGHDFRARLLAHLGEEEAKAVLDDAMTHESNADRTWVVLGHVLTRVLGLCQRGKHPSTMSPKAAQGYICAASTAALNMRLLAKVPRIVEVDPRGSTGKYVLCYKGDGRDANRALAALQRGGVARGVDVLRGAGHMADLRNFGKMTNPPGDHLVQRARTALVELADLLKFDGQPELARNVVEEARRAVAKVDRASASRLEFARVMGSPLPPPAAVAAEPPASPEPSYPIWDPPADSSELGVLEMM